MKEKVSLVSTMVAAALVFSSCGAAAPEQDAEAVALLALVAVPTHAEMELSRLQEEAEAEDASTETRFLFQWLSSLLNIFNNQNNEPAIVWDRNLKFVSYYRFTKDEVELMQRNMELAVEHRWFYFTRATRGHVNSANNEINSMTNIMEDDAALIPEDDLSGLLTHLKAILTEVDGILPNVVGTSKENNYYNIRFQIHDIIELIEGRLGNKPHVQRYEPNLSPPSAGGGSGGFGGLCDTRCF